jgi:hypothetical protein
MGRKGDLFTRSSRDKQPSLIPTTKRRVNLLSEVNGLYRFCPAGQASDWFVYVNDMYGK